jgi:hypothetical protein
MGSTRKVSPVATSSVSPTMTAMGSVMRRWKEVIGSRVGRSQLHHFVIMEHRGVERTRADEIRSSYAKPGQF